MVIVLRTNKMKQHRINFRIKKKPLFLLVLLLLIFTISVFVIQLSAEKKNKVHLLNQTLTTYNHIIANIIGGDNIDSTQLAKTLAILPDKNLRLTILDSVGNVLFDSEIRHTNLKNHLHRPEIQLAKTNKIGYNIRESQSSGLPYYYLAEKFDSRYIRSALIYDINIKRELHRNFEYIYYLFALFLFLLLGLWYIIYLFHLNFTSLKDQQNNTKKQLTQNISHELKTPVSSIHGYLETILQTSSITEEKKNYFIERCYAQSIRLTHLVNEISLLNKIDTESGFFLKETLNLKEVIHSVLKDAEVQVEKKNAKIECNLPTKELYLEGNRSLLYSIFRNLVDNSIAYAGEHFTIKLSCEKEDEQFYYFSYSDNGVGIEEMHLSRIFDRFYRVNKGRSRKMGGSGLGLAIVKNSILFHGGNIQAKNIEKGGIAFQFTLAKL